MSSKTPGTSFRLTGPIVDCAAPLILTGQGPYLTVIQATPWSSSRVTQLRKSFAPGFQALACAFCFAAPAMNFFRIPSIGAGFATLRLIFGGLVVSLYLSNVPVFDHLPGWNQCLLFALTLTA